MLRLLLMITFVTALTDARPASANPNPNTSPDTPNTGTPNTEKSAQSSLPMAIAGGAHWALPNAPHPATGRCARVRTP